MSVTVIFLDIDGVLNNTTNPKDPFYLDHRNWGEEHCRALAAIVEQTNSKIVISSTWRQLRTVGANRIEWWNEQFSHAGIPPVCIDLTDHSPNAFRGREVNMWLAANSAISYLILDDSCDFYPDQPRIHVDGSTGLLMAHVKPAVALLNGAAFAPLPCMTEYNPPVN